MRLPEVHKLLFQVIKKLNVEVDENSKVNLIPYYLDNPNTAFLYNGTKVKKSDIKDSQSLNFPLTKVIPTADEILAREFQPLVAIVQYAATPEEGMKNLKKLFDHHTVYSYLKQYLSSEELGYINTLNALTDIFGIGLVECIVDTLLFAYNKEWYTIDKGMSRLPEALKLAAEKHKVNCLANHTVTGISHPSTGKVKVHLQGKPAQDYDTVIVTVPFGVVRFWSLPNDWTYYKLRAIRDLHYESSTKVLLKYDDCFWFSANNNTIGGLSCTDMPVRTVVYPSFPAKQSASNPGVLLASYTWSTDALRMAALGEEKAGQIATRDVKKLFDHGDNDHNPTATKMQSWTSSPYSNGAFAMFGAGQFTELYEYAIAPEKGTVFFAGEHLSVNHGWIEGALESSLRALLQLFGSSSKEAAKLRQMWKAEEQI